MARFGPARLGRHGAARLGVAGRGSAGHDTAQVRV